MNDRPPPKIFPKLAEVMRARGVEARNAPSEWGSHERVRRWLLHFGHPDRRIPDEPAMRLLIEWGEGELAAGDFYPADLRAPAPSQLAYRLGEVGR